MKRMLAAVFVIALGAAVGLFLYGQFADRPVSDWAVVATVNNEPIYAREFKVGMAENRAEIYAYFKRTYNVDGGRTFWTDRYGGESPLEMIRKITLDEIVQYKVQQIMLKTYGIQPDIGYKSFVAAWKEANKQRQQDLKRNKVIYGPAAYGEAEYFKYLFHNGVNQLKHKLYKTELDVSEFEQIDQAYEEWIEQHMKEADVRIDAKVYNSIEAM